MLKKSIAVFTDDPVASRITLTISGNIVNFAKIKPKYVRLVGNAGTDIKTTITITREEAYPFSIVEAKARNGKDISIDIKEFENTDGKGYTLTIENKKKIVGRYADTVVLKTDSKVKPIITIPVYGQIISEVFQQPRTEPSKKSAGEG